MPSRRRDGKRCAGLPDEATCATLDVASSPNGEPTRVYERPHDSAGAQDARRTIQHPPLRPQPVTARAQWIVLVRFRGLCGARAQRAT